MKKTELQEIADLLANNYGSGRHFEIIKAEKMGNYEDERDGWRVEIKPTTEIDESDEEAENDSN